MDSYVNRLRVHSQDTLIKVMNVMDNAGRGLALVVNEAGQLLGVVTDGDIRRALLKGTDSQDSIEGIITRDPVVLSEGASGDDAEILRLLQSEKFKKRGPIFIPIVDDQGQPTRLVSLEELHHFNVATSPKQRPGGAKNSNQVLVIGGAGYIGSVLVRRLLKAGYRVRVLDLLLYGGDSLDEVRDNPNFEFHQGDTRHIDTLLAAIQDVDSVIHLAELVGDPVCDNNPVLTLQTNYLSTLTIAQICTYLQINRFVYTSSCSVYGASADPELILNESSELSPVSLYGRMKINAERTILGMSSGNFSPCILRFGTVFGASPRPRFDLVVNTLTTQAFYGGKIHIFGGEQWRPHLHVSDAACAIQTVLESPIEDVAAQVFNIVGENLKIETLGKLVGARLPDTSVIYDSDAKDPRNYRVSGDKAAEKLGFRPSVRVTEGIEELVRYLESGKIVDYKDKRYQNVLMVADWG